MNPPSVKELQNQIKKLQARIGSLEEALAVDKSSYKIGTFGPTLSFATERLDAIDKVLRSITAQGAVFAKGGALNRSIEDIAFQFDKYAGSAELGNVAFQGLVTGFEQFNMLASSAGDNLGSLTTELTLQAGAMDRLGLSIGDYSKNLDIAMNVFNLTEQQVKGINRSIVNFANDIEMLPSVVSRNFQLVAQSLAYEAPKVLDQFKKLQRMSQETGVAMPSLLSGFGERLDQIQGASSFSGQLNAILGGNYITPDELFAMDEAQRALRIREILQGHRIYDEIKSGSRLGKFATATTAKILGYDRAETRKFILSRAEDGDTSLRAEVARRREIQLGAIRGTTTDDDIATERDLLTRGGQGLRKDFKKDAQTITRAYLGASDQAKVAERSKRFLNAESQMALEFSAGSDQMKSARMDFMNQFRDIDLNQGQEINNLFPGNMLGVTTAAEKIQMVAVALRRQPQLYKLLANLQTLPIKHAMNFRSELASIIMMTGGVSAPTQKQATKAKKSLMDMERLRGEELKADLVDPFRIKDDLIDFDERTFLKSLPTDQIGTGYYRQLIRKFRAEGGTSEKELKKLEADLKKNKKPEPKKTPGVTKTLVPKKEGEKEDGLTFTKVATALMKMMGELPDAVKKGASASTPNVIINKKASEQIVETGLNR